MTAGGEYAVSVTMRNTGSNTWSPGQYVLGAQNPHENLNWGSSRISLSTTVAPGQSAVFSWTVTAPSVAGSYNFQWRLLNIGVEWFGELSANVVVDVQGASTLPNDAVYVAQTVPTVMNAGQQYQVSVTMRNTGSNTWTSAGYRLGAQNPHDNSNWGASRVAVPGGVAPGQEAVVAWTVTAPSTPGSYNFQWRMLNVGVEWFGEPSQNIVVNVQGGTGIANDAVFLGQTVPAVMNAGEQYQVSVTMRNTGTNTWTAAGYRLGAQNPHDNKNWGASRIAVSGSVAPGQDAVVTWTVTAPSSPGTYNFQWRMLNLGVEWFGERSANVVISVQGGTPLQNGSSFVSQSVPAVMSAGAQVEVSVVMRNTGTSTWTTAAYRLGAQNPHDNSNWGLSRVALPGDVSPGQDAVVTWTVAAPSTPGSYNFQWRMLNLGVEWFGELSANFVVTVQ
jgi:hypothetical protein